MAEDTIIIDKVEFSADKKILLDFFAEQRNTLFLMG